MAMARDTIKTTTVKKGAIIEPEGESPWQGYPLSVQQRILDNIQRFGKHLIGRRQRM
jgi:hypothetical protein